MARVKYYDSTTQTWKYADMALQTGIHVGTTAPTNEAMLWVDTASNQIDSFPLTDVQDSDGNSLIVNQIAVIPSIPSGTNNGDILVWDGDEWVSKPKWQMIYQPVEYIESTGTQCINTGVIPNAGTEWELKVSDITNTSEGYFLGADYNTSNKFSFLIFLNTWYGNIGSTGSTGIPLSASDDYLCSLKNGTLSINENQVSLAGSLSTAKNLFLLTDPSKASWQKCRLYYFKLWNNGTLIRDYIPVYNIYTCEAGLYDKANNKFYGNAGSGSFTHGADVN